MARRLNRPCAVITFEPHPADVFAGARVVFRLTPEAAKALILRRLGLDGMIVLPFGPALARLTADQFVDQILVERFGVCGVVVGFDFRFGADRGGASAFLTTKGAARGFEVDVVEKVADDARGSLEGIHSTSVRAALAVGDVGAAAHLLGRPWFVLGEVIHGKKLGRTLGFPTANLALDPSCRLRHGIYAVRARRGECVLAGVASFGTRPTVDDGPPLLEVFLFDFSGDLYGEILEVEFVAFIRDELKFDGLEALVSRMQADVDEAKAALAAQAR